MDAVTWEICRADFAFDGALIDLIVPGSGDAEWEAFWTAVRGGPFELRATRDGEPIPFPESAAWVFAEREHATILHLLGLDHTRLTYRHAGRDYRLTDVHGNVVTALFA